MDEMIMKSKVFTSIISKIVSKSLKKQFGVDCEIKVNEIAVMNDGNMTNVQLDIDVETSKISELIGKVMKD